MCLLCVCSPCISELPLKSCVIPGTTQFSFVCFSNSIILLDWCVTGHFIVRFILTLKVVADDILFFFSQKISLDISCESSAVCLADDSYEMSRRILKINVVCCSCDWHFKG